MYTGQFTMDIPFDFLFDILKHQFKHAILSIRVLKIFFFFSENVCKPNYSIHYQITFCPPSRHKQYSLGLCMKYYNYIIHFRVITRLTNMFNLFFEIN